MTLKNLKAKGRSLYWKTGSVQVPKFFTQQLKIDKHEHNLHQRKHRRSVAGTSPLDQSGTRHSRNRQTSRRDSLGLIIKRKNQKISVLSFLTLTLTVVVWSSCDWALRALLLLPVCCLASEVSHFPLVF